MSQPPQEPASPSAAPDDPVPEDPAPEEPAPEDPVPGDTKPGPKPVRGRQPDRVLLGIAAALVVLVAVALSAVFLRGEPQQLDGSSPAGVV